MAQETKRYAVVTGGNRGIGFGICKQLASNGIVVISTARDEKKGLESVQKLRDCGLSDFVLFHQLDVTDPSSVAALADFITARIGKLDILVNNAGVPGVQFDWQAIKASDFGNVDATGMSGVEIEGDSLKLVSDSGKEGAQISMSQFMIQTYEIAEQCLEINYYGAKRMIEALVPLLKLSDSPRIVNVSSSGGLLKRVTNEEAKDVLSDVEKLSEERIDGVIRQFLKDFKEGSAESKGWPPLTAAFTVSKASLNAYTRLQAKKLPSFLINCVCPGVVKTEANLNMGILTVDEGAESPVSLALLPNDGPSGHFFSRKEEADF